MMSIQTIPTKCTVSWCGNKCSLYCTDIKNCLTYNLITSLRVDGICPHRPSYVWGYDQSIYDLGLNKGTGGCNNESRKSSSY